jgi:extracellular matrix regulatory protein A
LERLNYHNMPRVAKPKPAHPDETAPEEITGVLKRTLSQPAEIEFVSIGFGSSVAMHRVLAVLAPDTAPVRRLVQDARADGMLLDATHGRKTKAVLVLDTGHVLAAALQPETILGRYNKTKA